MNRYVVTILLAGLLAACVTINIYFPAAAAQEVADQIIDDVWQIKEGDETKAPTGKHSETKGSNLTETSTPEAK